MVALPFCYLALKTQKPRNSAYPEHLNSLGDQTRTRRLDLGMHQKDVAEVVTATTSTVTNWEKNRTNSRLYLLPKIIQYLGYDPFPAIVATFGEKINQYRRKQGLSIKKFAKILSIDPTTLARWEGGERQPSKKHRKRLDILRLF